MRAERRAKGGGADGGGGARNGGPFSNGFNREGGVTDRADRRGEWQGGVNSLSHREGGVTDRELCDSLSHRERRGGGTAA